MNKESLIENLNAAQQQAVTAPMGGLLVLAGAGSGKTRVLVNRIAWLIATDHASPHSIFAVTFTNKAAHEMRARLADMLQVSVGRIWVGTFHGLAHKLLRMHSAEAGLPQSFQVLDSDDQLRLIKKVFKKLNIDDERWEPKKAQHFINSKKDDGLSAHQLAASNSMYEQVMSQIYAHYEKECETAGVVDFADLLLRAYKLLKNNSELLDHYRARFRHFLVDEFQDTNTIQYLWLTLMAATADSITVVGDDDQSIYGWRGAKIENIKRFQHDFPGTNVVRLEQNYRSTSTILQAANSLIDHNSERMGKTLWTDGDPGEAIKFYLALNEDDEAIFIIRNIKHHLDMGFGYNDIAVLYRSNAQSRIIEEALVRSGIPYSVYGGLRFFERAEIKDALAYLRLAVNPSDDQAFERVINVPPRGIGKKSVEKIQLHAIENQSNLLNAAYDILESNKLTGKAKVGTEDFLAIIADLQDMLTDSSVMQIVDFAINKSGLLTYFKEQKGEKAQSRAENLEELINATSDFVTEEDEHSAHLNPLTEFLAYTSLDAGDRQGADQQNSVQLMTLHSAKGLEFPIVFICGLEETLFPHQLSIDNVEEERRLCYVGITRAMQILYLTAAQRRRLFGREESRRVSRFISEIPENLLEDRSRKMSLSNSSSYHLTISNTSVDYSESQDYAGDTGFLLGQKVKHRKFGVGTIIDFEGAGERARVSVRFEHAGTKWLAINYANLEPV